MPNTIKKMQTILERRHELKQELSILDHELQDMAINELHPEILGAYVNGVIKFNFPMPAHIYNAIMDKMATTTNNNDFV